MKTFLNELPLHHKITFHQEVYNEKQELLAKGHVILYFVKAGNMHRATMPEPLLEKLKPFF